MRGRVTDVGSSGIQAVFHQLFHGRAEAQHDLPRADAMDRAAVDGPDGPGELRAGERRTAKHGGKRGSKPRSGLPTRAGGEAGTGGSRNRASSRGTARARSAAAVRGAKRPGRRGRTRGPGPVHTLTRAQPPPSGPRRGGTRRAPLRRPERARPARTGLWGRAPPLNTGQWQEGGRASP